MSDTVSSRWTSSEIAWLNDNYPMLGKAAAATHLGRTIAAVRYKASVLGLKLDRTSEFYRDFQRRAGLSKVGVKRPEQALVLRRLHEDGKMRRSHESRTTQGLRHREWLTEHGHPRGALGMRHTPETKKKISDKSSATWARFTDEQKQERNEKIMRTRAINGVYAPERPHGSWKAAWCEIGGVRAFYRSRWEANYARYLQWLKERGVIVDWAHEPDVFWFKGIKRGTVSYLPDFRVVNKDGTSEYHEVKGWMDDRSKTKLKRMAKYHPTVKLVLVDSKSYRALEKTLSTVVPGWEK